MVGRTLADIRARLDELSVAVGPFRVVSAKTGDGPVPVTGRQFTDRATAAEAATVATAYRRALRRYDPQVAVHDLIVTQTAVGSEAAHAPQSLPEYCHTVTGALFETLADRHGPVERAVMDTYLSAAETTGDRERLCLKLLESTAATIDARLTADEQATVLLGAASRLPGRRQSADSLGQALDSLQSAGLVERTDIGPVPAGPGRRSKRVTLRGYRPSLPDGRCPVLPVAAELLRRTGVPPHIERASATDDGWELLVSMTGDTPAEGLSVVPASS